VTGTFYNDWITWAAQVQAALAGLGDVKRQRAAWTSSGRIFFPDPTALAGELLDEAHFEEFLEHFADDLGAEFVREGRGLARAVERFPHDRLVKAADVLRDRAWLALTRQATALAGELDALLDDDDLDDDDLDEADEDGK
jgi:hypothetical protein